MNQKFKYIKSLVFNHFQNITIGFKNNHFVHTVNFKGITNLPFYIVGVNYDIRIWDKGLTVTEKIFNYNDPLIFSEMQIVAQSTNDMYGDSVNTEITGGLYSRFIMNFQPGVLYDFSSFPVVVSDPVNNFIFDVYLDPAYILVGEELYCIPSFKLFIGTN